MQEGQQQTNFFADRLLKSILVALLVSISLLLGLLLGRGLQSYDKSSSMQSSLVDQTQKVVQQVTSPVKQEIPGDPNFMEIPSIQVNSQVESVGLDSQGRMDVPVNADNVGWYNLGAKPGEKGNAVIDGHLDKVTGLPAAFYNLSKLSRGDDIYITDIKGKRYHFRVTKKVVFKYNEFPLNEIFGDADKPMLNLITCEGAFDQTSANYSHRTVIYSELVDNTK